RTGTVNINEGYASAYGSVQAPMGGMKDSGLGRRHGAEGILKYTEAQTVAHQRLLPMAPSLGLDDEEYARLMTRGLRLMKAFRLR
ncbi:aldehyde dehydrogenase family protein, partial [Streptomyces sp. TRM76130]|nr:aldehyde dehydrogenase family protein [Streptomyces sp. TRM76130]